MVEEVTKLFDKTINPHLIVYRINIPADHVVGEKQVQQEAGVEQLDLFMDYDVLRQQKEKERTQLDKEKALQQVTLQIKKKYEKNATLKGTNLGEGANTTQRNRAISGHKT